MIQQYFSQFFSKFRQIKEKRPIFLVGTNSAERLNYLVPPSVFQFMKFEGPKFFAIHCTSLGSNNWFTSTFLSFLNFPQIKEGRPNFLVETKSAERLSYLVSSSVFQFRKFKGLKFFVIPCTSVGSNWFTSTFLNFLKYQFFRTTELFGLPFCISILEIWSTQILRHSLDFSGFYMIHQYFS